MEAAIKGILTEPQFTRYRQIGLQVEGAAALGRPDIAKKVGLSDEQVQQIHEIVGESFRPPPPPDAGGPGGDPRAAMRKARDEANAKVLTLLNADQLSAWKAMLGTPFHLEGPPRGGPGPGGPGGPPPPPPGG